MALDTQHLLVMEIVCYTTFLLHVIRKSECANQSMKCYRASLEMLVEEKTRYKGKGKLTESMRKKLTKAARCSIKMRGVCTREAVKLLCEDLHNVPYHYFCGHSRCSTDYQVRTASMYVKVQMDIQYSHYIFSCR